MSNRLLPSYENPQVICMNVLYRITLMLLAVSLVSCTRNASSDTQTSDPLPDAPAVDETPFYSKGLSAGGVATLADGTQRPFTEVNWFCPQSAEPGAPSSISMTFTFALTEGAPTGQEFRMEEAARRFDIKRIEFGPKRVKRKWRDFAPPVETPVCNVKIEMVDGTEKKLRCLITNFFAMVVQWEGEREVDVLEGEQLTNMTFEASAEE